MDSEILGQLAKLAAHGVTGSGLQEAQGGEFLAGFAAAGFTQLSAPGIELIDGGDFGAIFGRVAAASVIGGTASVLAGGKFENGAVMPWKVCHGRTEMLMRTQTGGGHK